MTATRGSNRQRGRPARTLGLRPASFEALGGSWKSMYVLQQSPTGLSVHELKSWNCITKQGAGAQHSAGSSQGPTSRILDDVHLFMSKLTKSNLNHSFRYSNNSLLHPWAELHENAPIYPSAGVGG